MQLLDLEMTNSLDVQMADGRWYFLSRTEVGPPPKNFDKDPEVFRTAYAVEAKAKCGIDIHPPRNSSRKP